MFFKSFGKTESYDQCELVVLDAARRIINAYFGPNFYMVRCVSKVTRDTWYNKIFQVQVLGGSVLDVQTPYEAKLVFDISLRSTSRQGHWLIDNVYPATVWHTRDCMLRRLIVTLNYSQGVSLQPQISVEMWRSCAQRNTNVEEMMKIA
jgi:hypothetical protein